MTHTFWSQDLYIKAYKFAAIAHEGQLVPGTSLPYIMHLNLVCMEIIAALRIEQNLDENLAIQCALLHDVIEDTKITYAEVEDEFGRAVAAGVLALTKDKTLDKPLQMPDSLQRIKQHSREIWMVKLADRITNLQPPPSHWTKEKIRTYQKEAALILETLGDSSRVLSNRLKEKIEAFSQYVY